MNKENVSRSVLIFSISLIAPFLVWVLLRQVGSFAPESFDPSPWIQGLVQKPAAVTTDDKTTRWIHVVSKNGELFIEKNTTETPLAQFADTSEKVIFLVHAQGPTLAKKFYDFLIEHKLPPRSLILSNSDGFLKDLRYYDGNLTLSCGQAYVVRWRALKQLDLHNLMTINMSAVWLDPAIFATSFETLTKYFTALHVPVFIGPVTAEQAKSLPAQANFLILPPST